jgi:carbonic anhydrase
MRLIEALIDANHRALAGDANAGLHLADYADELPIVAMTCIDPRLSRLLPGAMGLPPESFIWLRNAGNIITDPLSSMTRSLSLACAVKGGKEIAIIGHTDCQVCKTSLAQLIAKYKEMGIERAQLPDNLTEYFAIFSDERQNVRESVDRVRKSPLISRLTPVQGLMVDIVTGKLEWVVNGYEALQRLGEQPAGLKFPEIGIGSTVDNLTNKIGSTIGEIRTAETKIGEVAAEVKELVAGAKPVPPIPPAPSRPPPIPQVRPASSRTLPVPPPIQYPKR